jgi:carbon monoxide dehydrogenase subunit G
MITNTIVLDINAPPEEVWGFFSDVERWPQWMESVSSVSRQNSRATVGYKSGETMKIELTTGSPDEGFQYVARSKTMEVRANMSFGIEEDGTRLEYREELESKSLLMRFLQPFIKGSIRRGLEADFERAKRLIEVHPGFGAAP